MTDIPGGADDPLTIRHDALSIAFDVLCRRLLANGALRASDLGDMRTAALEFPFGLLQSSQVRSQVGGARLADALSSLFDRLEHGNWMSIDTRDPAEAARLLLARHGSDAAGPVASMRIRELAALGDRHGVEAWCRVVRKVEELTGRQSTGGDTARSSGVEG